MGIGEVARRAGVRPSLLRFYEDAGLIEPPLRVSGRRRYDPSVLARLTAIAAAQRAGLTLAEIRETLDGGTPRLRELAREKLPEAAERIAAAERSRDWLRAAADCRCATVADCALFA